jgi:hypothetical protein
MRILLPGTLLLPLALTVYFHLPVSHRNDPPIDAFRDIDNKVKWGLVGEDLAGTTFADRMRYKIEGSGPRRKLSWFGEAADKNLPLFVPYFRGALGTLFLGFAVAGLLRTLVAGPRAAGLLIVFCFAVNTLFYLNFLSLDIEDFLVPSILMLAVGAGVLLDDIGRLIGVAGGRGVAATAVLIGLFLFNTYLVVGSSDPPDDYRHTASIMNHERDLLSGGFPPDARILLPWSRAAAMRYLQVVEGIRRDLEIHPMSRQNFLRVALQLPPGRPIVVEDVNEEMRRHFIITSRNGFFELQPVEGKSVD